MNKKGNITLRFIASGLALILSAIGIFTIAYSNTWFGEGIGGVIVAIAMFLALWSKNI